MRALALCAQALALRQAGSQAACAAVIAGMGLYCDACERLCRAYGEWFSWNCPSCDFDMCNKCLEESRNSWAVLPTADQAPQHSGSLLCNIKGSWTLCPSGIENEDEPEQQLGERPPPTDLQTLPSLKCWRPIWAQKSSRTTSAPVGVRGPRRVRAS